MNEPTACICLMTRWPACWHRTDTRKLSTSRGIWMPKLGSCSRKQLDHNRCRSASGQRGGRGLEARGLSGHLRQVLREPLLVDPEIDQSGLQQWRGDSVRVTAFDEVAQDVISLDGRAF